MGKLKLGLKRSKRVRHFGTNVHGHSSIMDNLEDGISKVELGSRRLTRELCGPRSFLMCALHGDLLIRIFSNIPFISDRLHKSDPTDATRDRRYLPFLFSVVHCHNPLVRVDHTICSVTCSLVSPK